jgi:hypothetical protein
MAQDPGRVFPGKRMTGHWVMSRNHAKPDIVRIDEARLADDSWRSALVPKAVFCDGSRAPSKPEQLRKGELGRTPE